MESSELDLELLERNLYSLAFKQEEDDNTENAKVHVVESLER